MRKILTLSAALSAFLFTGAAVADHSWNGYHIARTANPFIIQYVDSTTSVWDSTSANAVSHWAQSTVLNFELVGSDDGSRTRKRCPAITGQMRLCNAAYGQNGWLGLATIGLDSNGHIDQGTVKVNDSYDWYFTPEEMNHTMCQEIGHVVGLGHTSEDGSTQNTCMDYSSSTTSQWPNQHDYDMIQQIYSHVDSYNSFTSGTGGGGSGCNAPPGKGCNKFGAPSNVPAGLLVHKSGYHEVYVEPRADGGYWVYHVTRAPEAGTHR